jgi:predicted PhzF superfamily epimerase YddE/YHI9
MAIPMFQVDAFTSKPFGGNPAAVCLLETWPDDARLQAIAAENNLSETAYVVPEGQDFRLRWFTPTTEVALCGHATLATAWVLLVHQARGDRVTFHTLSGPLHVHRTPHGLEMDFPASPPHEASIPHGLVDTLGSPPERFLFVRRAPNAAYYLAVYATQAEVAALTPDTLTMGETHRANIIATAPGDDVDFVSRFFAPASGIPEDPVTGSAHCALAPYWTQRLGRNPVLGHQISRRGGHVHCEVVGDRVRLGGRCTLFLEGQIVA